MSPSSKKSFCIGIEGWIEADEVDEVSVREVCHDIEAVAVVEGVRLELVVHIIENRPIEEYYGYEVPSTTFQGFRATIGIQHATLLAGLSLHGILLC